MRHKEKEHTTVNVDKQTAESIKLIAKQTGKKQIDLLNEIFDKFVWLVSSMDLTKPFELEYEFCRTDNTLTVSVHGKPNLICESIKVKPTKAELKAKPLIVLVNPRKQKLPLKKGKVK